MYDTVGIYLEEVSAHTLLDAEDEVRLARAMQERTIVTSRRTLGSILLQAVSRDRCLLQGSCCKERMRGL